MSKEDGGRNFFVQAADRHQKGTDRKTDRGQMKFQMEGARRKKFQKEDSGRKYFIPAADGRQKGQTEKQTGQMKF